ncbi:hypothetical protein ACP70R_046415 [Stipagrostis hirtigluma subsp. patula]
MPSLAAIKRTWRRFVTGSLVELKLGDHIFDAKFTQTRIRELLKKHYPRIVTKYSFRIAACNMNHYTLVILQV